MDLLVDAAWLSRNRDAEHVRIVDVRWYLRASPRGKSAREEYDAGHIPGAYFLDLDRDLSAPSGPGRHPIPTQAALVDALSRIGGTSDTHFVVYDDAGGSIAARFWWLLRHFGHPRVSVLDGGIDAWKELGEPLTVEVPSAARSAFSFSEEPRADVVDKKEVQAALCRRALLVDARASDRFRGETEPVDARPGHIPGAKNAPWAGNLDRGRFRSSKELAAFYAALGAKGGREVILYCGSGVTACHDLLALERAGISGAKLYEGSWSDWARDPSLPVAKGDE